MTLLRRRSSRAAVCCRRPLRGMERSSSALRSGRTGSLVPRRARGADRETVPCRLRVSLVHPLCDGALMSPRTVVTPNFDSTSVGGTATLRAAEGGGCGLAARGTVPRGAAWRVHDKACQSPLRCSAARSGQVAQLVEQRTEKTRGLCGPLVLFSGPGTHPPHLTPSAGTDRQTLRQTFSQAPAPPVLAWNSSSPRQRGH